jgi:LysM repeat protein
MRFNAIGILAILLVLSSIGCQENELPATEVAMEVGPQPTPVIGVDFATVTPTVGANAQVVAWTPATNPPPTAMPTAAPEAYIVQAGDTLVGIAAARGASLEEILALNSDVRPEFLLVGQEIIVPPRPEIEPTAAPPSAGRISVEIAGLKTYVSATGGSWVLGEIVNSSLQAVELVQVWVAMMSPEGETLASETVWITPVIIPSSGRAPFGALFSEVSPVGAIVQADIVAGRPVNNLGNRYLDLAVIDAEVTIGDNPIRVAGSIENQGQYPAGQISLVTTFYDDQGSVTGFHELGLDETVEPGESRPFAFTSLPPGGRADSYVFVVEATVVQ